MSKLKDEQEFTKIKDELKSKVVWADSCQMQDNLCSYNFASKRLMNPNKNINIKQNIIQPQDININIDKNRNRNQFKQENENFSGMSMNNNSDFIKNFNVRSLSSFAAARLPSNLSSCNFKSYEHLSKNKKINLLLIPDYCHPQILQIALKNSHIKLDSMQQVSNQKMQVDQNRYVNPEYNKPSHKIESEKLANLLKQKSHIYKYLWQKKQQPNPNFHYNNSEMYQEQSPKKPKPKQKIQQKQKPLENPQSPKKIISKISSAISSQPQSEKYQKQNEIQKQEKIKNNKLLSSVLYYGIDTAKKGTEYNSNQKLQNESGNNWNQYQLPSHLNLRSSFADQKKGKSLRCVTQKIPHQLQPQTPKKSQVNFKAVPSSDPSKWPISPSSALNLPRVDRNLNLNIWHANALKFGSNVLKFGIRSKDIVIVVYHLNQNRQKYMREWNKFIRESDQKCVIGHLFVNQPHRQAQGVIKKKNGVLCFSQESALIEDSISVKPYSVDNSRNKDFVINLEISQHKYLQNNDNSQRLLAIVDQLIMQNLRNTKNHKASPSTNNTSDFECFSYNQFLLSRIKKKSCQIPHKENGRHENKSQNDVQKYNWKSQNLYKIKQNANNLHDGSLQRNNPEQNQQGKQRRQESGFFKFLYNTFCCATSSKNNHVRRSSIMQQSIKGDGPMSISMSMPITVPIKQQNFPIYQTPPKKVKEIYAQEQNMNNKSFKFQNEDRQNLYLQSMKQRRRQKHINTNVDENLGFEDYFRRRSKSKNNSKNKKIEIITNKTHLF